MTALLWWADATVRLARLSLSGRRAPNYWTMQWLVYTNTRRGHSLWNS